MFDLFKGGIPSYLRKFKTLNSSASEIDSVVNVINPLLAPIHKLFRESANGIKAVKYIVVGDSTRDKYHSNMQLYYSYQLAKINMLHYDNAESGQTAYNWGHNISLSLVSECIANCIGNDGEDTIVEYSLGINDYSINSAKAYIKDSIKYGLDALLLAKPKIKLFFCIPVATTITVRNTLLVEIYNELAAEYNVPLIDTYTLTIDMPNNYSYYIDTTHPNKWISQKIVDHILWEIMPFDIKNSLTIDAIFNGTTPPSTTLTATKISGSRYGTTDGAINTDANWRRLAEITIVPNTLIKVTHQGNRNDFIFADSSGVFIKCDTPAYIGGVHYVLAPENATKLKINLASTGATYDALNDTVLVEYQDPATALYFSPLDLRIGTKIKNPINQFTKKGALIDSYGKIGITGESLKIDSSLKMKWSV